MEKILSSKVKIRFQDCDPFNHLNNSRYIDYFLNSREEQILEHYKLDVANLMNVSKIGWVVASNQISYILPVAVGETVSVRSQLIRFSERKLTVEMTMWNEAETQLKAILWVQFIHIDIGAKTVLKHSDEMMALFQIIAAPVDQTIFEDRQGAIIRSINKSADLKHK